jgi:hypothetical protein
VPSISDHGPGQDTEDRAGSVKAPRVPPRRDPSSGSISLGPVASPKPSRSSASTFCPQPISTLLRVGRTDPSPISPPSGSSAGGSLPPLTTPTTSSCLFDDGPGQFVPASYSPPKLQGPYENGCGHLVDESVTVPDRLAPERLALDKSAFADKLAPDRLAPVRLA